MGTSGQVSLHSAGAKIDETLHYGTSRKKKPRIFQLTSLDVLYKVTISTVLSIKGFFLLKSERDLAYIVAALPMNRLSVMRRHRKSAGLAAALAEAAALGGPIVEALPSNLARFLHTFFLN